MGTVKGRPPGMVALLAMGVSTDSSPLTERRDFYLCVNSAPESLGRWSMAGK